MSDLLRQFGAWATGIIVGFGSWLVDLNWLALLGALATLGALADRLHAMWIRHKREERLAMAEIDKIAGEQ